MANIVGLTRKKFKQLLPFFAKEYNGYFETHTFNGKRRKRKVSTRYDKVFKLPEDALFFILFYLKSYPTEEALAMTFDMYQTQVSIWKNLLLNILEKTFSTLGVLPSRKNGDLNKLIKEMNLKKIVIDATERPIQRPQDNEKQKDFYSGKKNSIALKTPSLLTEEASL